MNLAGLVTRMVKPLVDIICATSLDVEDHLYRLATNMGITVITSSQRHGLILFHSLELYSSTAKESGSYVPPMTNAIIWPSSLVTCQLYIELLPSFSASSVAC